MKIPRRRFFSLTARSLTSGMASLLGLGSLAHILKRKYRPPNLAPVEPGVLRPPGALPEEDFLAQCIRCVRCRDACPSSAIKLASASDPYPPGTPFISAVENACNLCLECTQTCPTEALEPIFKREEVKMGVAKVDPRTCVSINGTGVCGACHTACPFRNSAITQGLHNAPTVHEDFCVGCGLCEEACIVKGTKAIRVFSERAWS
jgi:ferredoxin-type protein NapG